MKARLSILFILCSLQAFSQPATPSYQISDSNKEQILVHLNSTFLITGETLYFKVFCRKAGNNHPTFFSKVAYVELIDGSGTPLMQTKVSLKEGSGHGDFFVPSTFASGNYTLIAYTRWMRNFPSDSFFANRITIVNPFRGPLSAASMKVKSTSEKTTIASPSADVQVNLSSRVFENRKRVSVTLTFGEPASVSVSVRKKEPGLDDSGTMLKRLVVGEAAQQDQSGSSANKGAYVPEMRGHLITGSLHRKEGGDGDKVCTVLAAIPGSDFVLRGVKTDKGG